LNEWIAMPPNSQDQLHSLEVFSPHNLLCMDETVCEIFLVMLGIEIHPCSAPAREPKEDDDPAQTAIIGFAGVISGLCEIRLSIPASIIVTSAMLGGIDATEQTEMICDAIGELCNLVAGGWKNRLPELSDSCSLTIPTVIEGELYKVHLPADTLVNHRAYCFGDHHVLQITLVYDAAGT